MLHGIHLEAALAYLYTTLMNQKYTRWLYNEFDIVGRDYAAQDEVDVYDSSHADFRDIAAESDRALDLIDPPPGGVIIEFGSGTGTFTVQAARRGLRVHAVDVSQAMLDRAQEKAQEAGVDSISFHHAGFLHYKHPDGGADAIASTFAFHHLPDFWKGIALKRMNRMLKPKGRLYLYDVVIEENDALESIQAFIDEQARAGGDFLRDDAEGHFRDEFSTYDWVMDELFERAGFEIEHKSIEKGVLAEYLCIKT